MKFFLKNEIWCVRVCLNIMKAFGFLLPDTHSICLKILFWVYWFFWVIFTNGIGIIIQCGDIIKIWGDLPLMVSSSFLLFTNLAFTAKIYTFRTKQEAVLNIIEEGDQELRDEDRAEGRDIINDTNRETSLQLRLYYFIGVVTTIGWVASAEKNSLPMRAWYPYDKYKSPAYEITFVHQSLALIQLATVNIGMDLLITALIAICRCRLRLLKLSLQTLCTGFDIKHDILTAEQEDTVYTRLRTYVIRHQAALRSAHEIHSCFTWPVLAQFTVSMVIICVTAYELSVDLRNDSKNVIHIVGMIAYLHGMVLQVFLYCYQGHQLAHESTEIAYAAYQCEWYACSMKFRRALLVVMVRSSRVVQLTAGGFTNLSLACFTSGESPGPERRTGESETEMPPPDAPPAPSAPPPDLPATTAPAPLPKSRSLVVSLTPPRERETWAKKAEFLLAVVGFAVDLGNVWRFPYICYQNGGGAFLIPYCVMLLFGGLPLFFMELALGQYHRCGCLTLWKRICPALKGVGYAICMIDIYMGMYYNTIIGWAVYYLIASLASINSELPWTSCNNEWNTPLCSPVTSPQINANASTPAKEFFERNVLEQQRSNGLDDMGPIKPSLALCVFGVFVLVYFSLWKGVRSAGKVVWVTALAPYVVLLILLARGVTLPGATEGIRYYLTPEWHKLKNTKVWIDAASQIFFSLGPGFGTLLALSSYNKFNNNCYRDALITSSINCLTSFLAGFVIFSVLGYMAHVQNKSIEEVGLEGPGLVFIVYPEAIATMTGSVFWAIIFFLMLITLGLDSTFGGLEAVTTALCDEYPRALGRHREIFVVFLLLFIYICALPTTTYGGVYLVDLLNVYGPGLAILFVVFAEAAGVFWVYGVDRFSEDVRSMLGHTPGWFWRVCWAYISPVFLLVLFVFSVLAHEEMLGGEYQYPAWSITVGWIMTGTTVSCIPLYIIYKLIITPGSFMTRIRTVQQPEETTVPPVDATCSL